MSSRLGRRQGPSPGSCSLDEQGLVADPRAAPSAAARPAGMPPVTVPHFRTVAQRGLPAPGTWVNITMVHDTVAIGCPHVLGFVFWNEGAARWERFAAVARSDHSHEHHAHTRTSAAEQPDEEPWSIPPLAIVQRRREVAAAAAAVWRPPTAAAPGGTCYVDGAALTPWWPEPAGPDLSGGRVLALDPNDPWKDSYSWVPASSVPPPPPGPPPV